MQVRRQNCSVFLRTVSDGESSRISAGQVYSSIAIIGRYDSIVDNFRSGARIQEQAKKTSRRVKGFGIELFE